MALPSACDGAAMIASGRILGLQLLGHQGGWDEVALVAGPILILGAVLWLANRRADRIASERDDPEPG